MSKAGSSGDSDWPKHFPPIPRNRFQKSGTQPVYEVTETKKACVMRVDMPGCPVSDLVYWLEGNSVHFSAGEPAVSEYNHDGRKYGGSMSFDPETYNVKEAKAKLLSGVLWITVPKIAAGTNAKIDVTEKMMNVKITREDAV